MTATDLDLDALLDALAARAAARAVDRPLHNQAGNEVTPYASTGRLVVHPGDTIASVWGNTTYDQTVQQFDSVTDRNTQWPTPKDGAMAYTVDTGTLWVRRAGTWKMVPLGYVASQVGPAATVTSGATATTIVSLTAPVTAGRRYRLNVFAFGQQAAAVGNSYFQLASAANIDSIQNRFVHQNGLPVGSYLIGSAAYLYTPGSSGSQTWTIQGVASAGSISTIANTCVMSVEDIGG